MARHYSDHTHHKCDRATCKDGKARVFNAVAPCDCDKGQLFHIKSNLPLYHQVIDLWNRLGSDKVFYTHMELPHLTAQHRYTAAHLEWLKNRATKEARRTSGGWKPAV